MAGSEEKYPIPESDMFLLFGLFGGLIAADYARMEQYSKKGSDQKAVTETATDSAFDQFWSKLLDMNLAIRLPSEKFNTKRYALTEKGATVVASSVVYLIAGEWPHKLAVIGTDALKLIEKYIEEGDAQAAVKLGELFIKGRNVEKSPRKAFELFTKAVKQSNPGGMLQLGLMHLRGEYVEENHKEALNWIHKAAALGDAEAMFALSGLYTGVGGIKADRQKVLEYLEKAVLAMHPGAMHQLGLLHARGQGGKPQNLLKAYIIYCLLSLLQIFTILPLTGKNTASSSLLPNGGSETKLSIFA